MTFTPETRAYHHHIRKCACGKLPTLCNRGEELKSRMDESIKKQAAREHAREVANGQSVDFGNSMVAAWFRSTLRRAAAHPDTSQWTAAALMEVVERAKDDVFRITSFELSISARAVHQRRCISDNDRRNRAAALSELLGVPASRYA